VQIEFAEESGDKVATEVFDQYPFQGVNDGKDITVEMKVGLLNVVRALLFLMRDRASCTITLKMTNGEFSRFVGISDFRMQLAAFGLSHVRESVDDDAREVVSGAQAESGIETSDRG
jgi:hypothetical protein